MKISEMIKKLKEIEKQHGDLECIFFKYTKGNLFQRVDFEPSVGTFEDNSFCNHGGNTFGKSSKCRLHKLGKL